MKNLSQKHFFNFISSSAKLIQILTIIQFQMDLDFENDLQINHNQHEDGYYQQYCRLFLANIALTSQIKELLEEKNHFKYRLSKYEDQQCYSSFERNQKAKRFRRNAHEIERFYKCTVKSCAKSYGSEGSLNQHYKLKHPEIYVSLPNVQSVVGQKSQGPITEKKQLTNDFRNSNSKVNSILKQLGDLRSFKSIRIEELRFDCDQNKQNKQNQCQNIPMKIDFKDGLSGKKQFLTMFKKDEPIFIDQAGVKPKRSSRTVKKREFNS